MYDNILKKMATEMNAPFEKLKEHAAKGDIYELTTSGVEYIRFRKAVGKIPKGTVIVLPDFKIIYGFPKIRRVLTLTAGLKNKFKDTEFYAEEKMDGYNVRLYCFDEKIVAFTRGGIISPYTAERIKMKGCGHLNEFFKDYPNHVLCGEVIGMQNPYQEKSYPEAEDFKFFVFDLMDKNGAFLPMEEKYNLIKKYNLPAVKNFGVFTAKDAPELLKIVRKLGDSKREGLVLKSTDGKLLVKYTSNPSTNSDLRYAFKFMYDYGQSFMFRRIVREAFQAYELNLNKKELEEEASELGKSLMIPMVDTIKQIAEGKEVAEHFDIVVPNEEFGKEFAKHLHHLGVIATIDGMEKTKEGVLIKMSRHYPSTNDTVKAYLKGEFSSD